MQDLRKKLQEERQAKEAAITKAQTFAAEAHNQQAAAAQSADHALAQVRNPPSSACKLRAVLHTEACSCEVLYISLGWLCRAIQSSQLM